jgi:GGDEF domain-containing protein
LLIKQQFAALKRRSDATRRSTPARGVMRGDRVLQALGDLLRQRSAENTMVVRFGGEQFALLVPRCSVNAAYQCG